MPDLTPLRVLFVEDSEPDAALIGLALQRAGYAVQSRRVTSDPELQAALSSAAWDVVISDYSLPGFDASRALARLQASGQDLPFIIISGTITEDYAVTALRAGAHDFILKTNLARLGPAVDRELRQAAERRQHRAAQARLRSQEANFRLLFASNPLPMWVYDAQTLAFLEVNEAACEQYGYSRAEFLGMRLSDLRAAAPPAPLPRADPPPRRLHSSAWQHCTKAGALVDVETVTHDLDFGGRPACVVVAYDITERRQAERLRQALLEIMQGLAATDDLQAFLGLVHKSVARVLYAENFFVTLYDAQTGLFEEAYSVDRYDAPAGPMSLEKSVSAYVFRTGRPLILTQARFDELVAQGEVELVGTNSPSWLGVPLKTSRGTIGVMVVQDYACADRYSEQDAELLASIAGQAALAVERKRAEEALRASERRFRALIEHSADAITLIDQTGTALYDSPSAARMLGYEPDELLGQSTFERMHPDDAAQARALLQQLRSGLTGPATGQLRLRHRSGAWRWVEFTVTDLSAEPSVQAVVVNYRDVTERRAAEAALQQAEAEFRTLVEQIPAITYRAGLDEHSSTLYISPQIARLGYTPEDHLANPALWIETVHPDDRERVLACFEQFSRDTQPFHVEYRVLDRQGRELWVADDAVVVRDVHGQPLYAQGVVVDITERKQAEAALRESEERFRSIVGTEPECVKIVAADGLLLDMNPAGLRLVEADHAGQVVGRSVYGLIHPADRDAYRQLHEIACGGGGGQQQFRVVGLRGTERWMESHSAPLRDQSGAIISVLSVTRDVTERKRAEAQLQQQIERMAALRATDMAITSSLDLRLTLNVFLQQATQQLRVDAADVLLADADGQTLTYAAGRGFRHSLNQPVQLRLGEGRAGRAALERRIVIETNVPATQPRAGRTGLLAPEAFASYFGVPLVAKGQVLGVLELFHRAHLAPDDDWMDFLEALAGQAAIAVENARLFDGLQRSHQDMLLAYDATIEGWSAALDLRDRETEGHSQRVTDLTLELARAYQMRDAELVHVRRGALLHDIGKVGIPDHILLKPGPLTDDEWVIMRQHPTLAHELLSPIAFLRPALDIPYGHHEKWDGSGYPRGLKGEQIPLAARLFAVVDVWDALLSHRPYRPAWPREQVVAHMRALAGAHLDPRAVDVFLKMVG